MEAVRIGYSETMAVIKGYQINPYYYKSTPLVGNVGRCIEYASDHESDINTDRDPREKHRRINTSIHHGLTSVASCWNPYMSKGLT